MKRVVIELNNGKTIKGDFISVEIRNPYMPLRPFSPVEENDTMVQLEGIKRVLFGKKTVAYAVPMKQIKTISIEVIADENSR